MALDIRLPRAARAFGVVFTVVWCALVASVAVRGARAGSAGALITLPMLTVGASLGYRGGVRLGVGAERDIVVVRNRWSTRTLARADIEDFRMGSPAGHGLPAGQAVQVLLRDGTVLPLDVTTRAWLLPGGRRRLQEQLQQLQAWRRG